MFSSKLLFYESATVGCPPHYGSFCRFIHTFKLDKNNEVELNISSNGCYAALLNGRLVAASDCRLLTSVNTYDTISLNGFAEIGNNTLCVYVFDTNQSPSLLYSVIRERKILAASGEHTLCAPCRGVLFEDGKITVSEEFEDTKNEKALCNAQYVPPFKNPIVLRAISKSGGAITQTGRYTDCDGVRYTNPDTDMSVSFPYEISGGNTYVIASLQSSCYGFAFAELEAEKGTVVELRAGQAAPLVYTSSGNRRYLVNCFGQTSADSVTLYLHNGKAKLYDMGMFVSTGPQRASAPIKFSDLLHERIFNAGLSCLYSDALDYYTNNCFFTSPDGAYELYPLIADLGYAYGEYNLSQAILNNICTQLTAENEPGCGGAMLIICIAEVLLFGGDRNFAKNCLCVIMEILKRYEARLGDDGLLTTESPGTYRLSENCMLLMAEDAARYIYAELGEDTQRCLIVRDRLSRAIDSLFWDRCAQLFASRIDGNKKSDFDELSQCLPVFSRAASTRHAILAVQFLFSDEVNSLPRLSDSKLLARYAAMLSFADNSRIALREFGRVMFEKFKDAQASRCLRLVSLYIYYRHCIGIEPTLRGFSGYSFTQEKCGFSYSGSIYTPRHLLSIDKNGLLSKKDIKDVKEQIT